MDSIISTFHIDWKTIIAQAVNFGAVFLVLYMFALKPLSKMMAERSGKISRGLTDAKENAILLERTKEEYGEALNQARAEAQKIFEEGKKEALKKKEGMMTEAKAEVDTMIENGRKTLEREKAKMLADARNELAGLAVKVAEKLVGKTLDTSFDAKAAKELSEMK